MKKYIYVGIGGIFGSLARYIISAAVAGTAGQGFPAGTFVINVSGCFLLGLFLTAVLEFISISQNLRLAVSTGFIGSYTTFSTFTNEINTMIIKQQLIPAIIYVILSFVSGISAVWLGTEIVRRYFRRT